MRQCVLVSVVTLGLSVPALAQPTGSWSAGASLTTPRADHAMALTSGGELVPTPPPQTPRAYA